MHEHERTPLVLVVLPSDRSIMPMIRFLHHDAACRHRPQHRVTTPDPELHDGTARTTNDDRNSP